MRGTKRLAMSDSAKDTNDSAVSSFFFFFFFVSAFIISPKLFIIPFCVFIEIMRFDSNNFHSIKLYWSRFIDFFNFKLKTLLKLPSLFIMINVYSWLVFSLLNSKQCKLRNIENFKLFWHCQLNLSGKLLSNMMNRVIWVLVMKIYNHVNLHGASSFFLFF